MAVVLLHASATQGRFNPTIVRLFWQRWRAFSKTDPPETGEGKFQIHCSVSSLRDRRMHVMGV